MVLLTYKISLLFLCFRLIVWFCFMNTASPSFVHRDLSIHHKNLNSNSNSNYSFYQFQRPGFHFRPKQNWMNDPNGPFYYRGYYHLFFQYNPFASVWGNITWGHAISNDLIHWTFLPLALQPNQWYDELGVWSGSVTILEDNSPVITYTGERTGMRQTQNLAFPANKSDPKLEVWVKYEKNPILFAPPAVNETKFRDPTTAWKGLDDTWRMLIGARVNESDVALLYKSVDFLKWNLTSVMDASFSNNGMWECPDFYPVSISSINGLDSSYLGSDALHVLKASYDDLDRDYYAIGIYDSQRDTWRPLDPSLNVRSGFRYDYGKFYASKTFFDSAKKRRILLGWVNESDTEEDDIRKGWASIHAIPRQVWTDPFSFPRLIQWPIEEFDSLRVDDVASDVIRESDVDMPPGSVHPTDAVGSQLDIMVSFSLPMRSIMIVNEENSNSNFDMHANPCTNSFNQNGWGGPFGVGVLTSGSMSEVCLIYFDLIQINGSFVTKICSDQSRSSFVTDLDKTSYGSFVPVHANDTELSLRIIVDHSVVETFAQFGRVVITARTYPLFSVNDHAKVVLFNNATKSVHVKSFEAYKLKSVHFPNAF